MNNLVKTSLVKYDLPFMINLPDDEYEVYFDDVYVTVKLRRTKSPIDMAGMPTGVTLPTDTYIEGDRWGKFNHTKLQFYFHHEILIKPYTMFEDYLFSETIDIINRMLSVCRGVKGDHYIKIKSSDIFSYTTNYFDLDNKILDESAFVLGNQNIVAIGGANEPTMEQVKLIKEVLSKNKQLPFFQELLLDAWDYHFYRNYKSAVIESGTAFEVFIYDYINNGYLKQKKSQIEIDNLLEQTSFKNLLIHHIKKITSYSFDESSNEFNKWNDNSYKLRNDIVHRGKNVSDTDSHHAITIVGDTIKFLISLK